MAKSRRNVSRRKRQQKRRNSRRNFRKMLGGGLVDNFTDEELETIFRGSGTGPQITETIKRLRKEKDWDDFIKDYPYRELLNHFIVKNFLEEKIKRREKIKKEEEEKERLEKLKEDITNGLVTEINRNDYGRITKQSGDGPKQFWQNNWVWNKEIQKYSYKAPSVFGLDFSNVNERTGR